MDMSDAVKNPAVRKYAPWILGGVVGVYLIYKFMGSGSSSTATTASGVDANYAAALNAQNQYSAQAASESLAAQTEQDQMTATTNQTNAALQASLANSQTADVQAAGSALSQVISAQSSLPIAAINAATTQNETALTAAATVAATANAAVPGALSGAGQILGASYQPLTQYGAAVANSGSVQAVNSFGANISSMTQAAQSTASTAVNRAQAGGGGGSSLLQTVGTVAAIAALA